jgi:cell division protein FtsQ
MKWNLTIPVKLKVIVAIAGISLLIAFSERKQEGQLCQDIVIDLDNAQENHFMDEADIMRLVESGNSHIKGTAIDRLNLKEIEQKLKYDKHILKAELYGDLKGNLIVNVGLRRPVARIVQNDELDYYISEDGTIMPVSEKYTSRVLLLSGLYTRRLVKTGNLNLTDEGKAIMEMIKYVNGNEFWKAQIAQLDIGDDGKIIIYPQVTAQRVEFGKAENIETKFKKLMIFYKEILPQRGWTRYARVNLEYEGQVIAE